MKTPRAPRSRRSRRSRCLLLPVAIVVTPALACQGGEGGTDGGETVDRSAVFKQLGEQVIEPTLAELPARLEPLRAAAASFCERRDALTLADAQRAWRDARAPWSRAEAFQFGPVAELGVASAIDFWPARPEDIEDALTLHDQLDAAVIDTLGATRKGFPVIEYLLFDDPDADPDPLARYPADAAGDLRCQYLEALTVDLHARAAALHGEWTGGYTEGLVTAGAGSEYFPKEQDAVDALVNALVSSLTAAARGKLEKPLTGETTSESRFSDNARADLRANLEGVAALYEGAYDGADASTPGLHTLVRFVDPALDERVREQLAKTRAAVDALELPLRVAVVDDPDAALALHAEVDALRLLFKLEVVSALSVTLSLTDNDGD
ncbi:MAG: imelysin family protein [Myxococcales bacterium]|nr:imelysin family protein [Myxococcales bacterium]